MKDVSKAMRNSSGHMSALAAQLAEARQRATLLESNLADTQEQLAAAVKPSAWAQREVVQRAAEAQIAEQKAQIERLTKQLESINKDIGAKQAGLRSAAEGGAATEATSARPDGTKQWVVKPVVPVGTNRSFTVRSNKLNSSFTSLGSNASSPLSAAANAAAAPAADAADKARAADADADAQSARQDVESARAEEEELRSQAALLGAQVGELTAQVERLTAALKKSESDKFRMAKDMAELADLYKVESERMKNKVDISEKLAKSISIARQAHQTGRWACDSSSAASDSPRAGDSGTDSPKPWGSDGGAASGNDSGCASVDEHAPSEAVEAAEAEAPRAAAEAAGLTIEVGSRKSTAEDANNATPLSPSAEAPPPTPQVAAAASTEAQLQEALAAAQAQQAALQAQLEALQRDNVEKEAAKEDMAPSRRAALLGVMPRPKWLRGLGGGKNADSARSARSTQDSLCGAGATPPSTPSSAEKQKKELDDMKYRLNHLTAKLQIMRDDKLWIEEKMRKLEDKYASSLNKAPEVASLLGELQQAFRLWDHWHKFSN